MVDNPKTCAHCGRPFTARRDTAQYCSARCRVGANRARERATIHDLVEEEKAAGAELRDDIATQVREYAAMSARLDRLERTMSEDRAAMARLLREVEGLQERRRSR